MKSLINPLDVFQNVGKHIKRFAYEKFGGNKKLADYLEISPSYLSQIVHGHRRPGRKIVLKLLAKGFSTELLEFYENLTLQNDYSAMSQTDLIIRIKQQNDLLMRKEEMLRWYEKRLNIHVKEQGRIRRDESKEKIKLQKAKYVELIEKNRDEVSKL